MSYILLEGGAEFGGQMAVPDRRAIELAGGPDAPIVIIPTAAAPDHNHERAGNNGKRWFAGLGASDVEVAPIVDRASANDESVAAMLSQAKLIYLLGGFTHYLGQTLVDSEAWRSIVDAHNNGAVVAGSSAGAMVVCEYYFNPSAGTIEQGLNLVPNACVLPHHNSFGKRWASQLRELLPGITLVGIDEQTGMINDAGPNLWSPLGAAKITLYRPGIAREENAETHGSEERFSL